ncbi:ABC-2 type transport system ATP-binding protein [Evansella caseinilytica]|uniref:ABC-2 type transport system ATP-binding protein n=1 Tax=Evansella caseinilytica TaxID=1503961 RepID=A0A1H3HLC1_9BACI|nr:ABC transporter ATP-binding protein [Evansella caseinilytica]SDY16257.1 ABC-2 type transport system ATP-binding protein [Evansella caseinilytica]
MHEPTITLTNVSKKYVRQQALAPLDLSLDHNGIVGLIGPNGSGKSTLLKLMAGLAQPTTGSITLAGKKITRRASEHIAFLAEIDSLYSSHTVKEAIQFFDGATTDFSREKAEEMLDKLKVDLHQKIRRLSKGNRARVKLVLTLSRNVPILLMDEPLSGLDPLVREDILKMIVSYVDVEKQMVILSTHEVSEVEPFLDYVIFMKSGSVLLNEKVETLREERRINLVEVMREVLQ